MNYRKTFTLLTAVILLSSCSSMLVRQQDLDAWEGMPVEALDTHSLFLTVPMVRTITESGIEIRNYANGRNFGSCAGFGSASVSRNWVNANAFSNCSSGWVGCNNIFYIKNGVVIEYAPTGRCYTDETVQPQKRYKRLKAMNDVPLGNTANAFKKGTALYFEGQKLAKIPDHSAARKSYGMAIDVLTPLAESGNLEAQNLIASVYAKIGKQDVAFKWRMKAAQEGFAPSQAAIGRHLYSGIGVEKDLQKAYEYLQKAAEQDHPYAKTMIPVVKRELGL